MKGLLILVAGLCFFYGSNAQQGGRLLISEVLFNPPRDGFDYVELFNPGYEAINLFHYLLANRNTAGEVSSIRRIVSGDFIVAPGKHVVISPDRKWLTQHFHVPDTVIVCEITSLPSYPDAEGSVVLLRRSDSSLCDDLRYSEDWHFPLLNDRSGVSLERISYDVLTQNPHNWASASSSSGYGTPGYQNSQYINVSTTGSLVSLHPKLFTPDNNGTDDYLTVTVRSGISGAVANSTIYDAAGRKVRHFLKNETLGIEDVFRWNGLDDSNRSCAPGLYILDTIIFNLQGQTKKFRNVVAIAYSAQ